MKLCTRCEIIKPLSDFYRHATHAGGRTYYCKICIKNTAAARYIDNHSEYINRIRDWRKNNPEKARIANKKARNKPIVKIRKSLRQRIKKILDYNSISRREAIGCSSKELKEHLQKQFKTGMSWDNYGSAWHVDHIRPLASFNLFEISEQRLANHFTNLQPLFAEENRKKGCQYTQQV